MEPGGWSRGRGSACAWRLSRSRFWLDDVHCSETGSRLAQCNHAGWGLHNCGGINKDHTEDVHLECFAEGTVHEPLTVEFQDVPRTHSGDEFSFRIAFSEPIDKEGQRLLQGPIQIRGADSYFISNVDDRRDLWELTIRPTTGERVYVVIYGNASCGAHAPVTSLCTPDGRPLSNEAQAYIEAKPRLTAQIKNAPGSHNGFDADFTIKFSEPIAPGFQLPVSQEVLEITNGRLSSIANLSELDPNTYLITMVLTNGSKDVQTTLKGKHACNLQGATCTPDGRRLSEDVSVTILAEPDTAALSADEVIPLTARFTNVPAEHDGETEFPVDLKFSEPPAGPGWYGARNIAVKNAIDITGGTIVSARSVEQNGAHRRIVVQPSGTGPVTVALPAGGPECGSNGALCTEAGGRLEVSALTQIRGPAALSVADATVEEGPEAVLEFAVTLSRAASGPVTVDYATRDGTAQAGADYTAATGTLAFAPSETRKTVHVTVLDDAHDEGSETMVPASVEPVQSLSGGRRGDGDHRELRPAAASVDRPVRAHRRKPRRRRNRRAARRRRTNAGDHRRTDARPERGTRPNRRRGQHHALAVRRRPVEAA